MSLTITQAPSFISPLYDKNPFVITSSNIAQENFYYLYYITDMNGTVSSSRQPQSPGGYGIFDPNVITKNKISYNFQPTVIGCDTNENTFYQYKISYGTISDGTYDTPVVTDIVNSFNSGFQLSDTTPELEMQKFLLNSSTSQVLTDMKDNNIVVNKNSYYAFNYIKGNFTAMGAVASNPYKWVFKFYKLDGTSGTYAYNDTSSYTTVSTSTFMTNPENIVNSVGVGPKNIMGTTFDVGGTITSSYFDDLDYYTVQAQNVSSVALSQVYTFKMKCDGNHKNYQIFYLNEKGGFDAIQFNKSNMLEISQKTKTFTKNPFELVEGMGFTNYYYTQGNRGMTSLNKVPKKRIKVYSDLIWEDDFDMYEKFMMSPTHILYQDGLEIPLNLITEKITLEDKFNRKMYKIPFTFEYSNKNKINL